MEAAVALQLENERATISGLFRGGDVSRLREQLFTNNDCIEVFHAARRIAAAGADVTVDTVFADLSAHRRNGRSVRLAQIDELAETLPTAAHFSAFVERLETGYVQRARARLALSLQDPACDLESCRAAFDALVEGGSRSRDVLATRRFDASRPPPPARPIFRLGKATIATPGNLMAIASQAKAGKSAVVGACIASVTGLAGDTLGFASENKQSGAVIHFDTEQSPHDHHGVVATAFRRVSCVPPVWLRSYSLVDVGIEERMSLLDAELARARHECGSIHSVFLDGVADFIRDPNDSEESFGFVSRLHAAAARYDTVIVGVLHFNPAMEGKTRGHLGSQLERKAETNLVLRKDDGGITVCFTTKARHASILEKDGSRFHWSDEAQMHISTETARIARAQEKVEGLRPILDEVFATEKRMRYMDTVNAIMRVLNCKSPRTAEKTFKELRFRGLLVKGPLGLWEPAPVEGAQ